MRMPTRLWDDMTATEFRNAARCVMFVLSNHELLTEIIESEPIQAQIANARELRVDPQVTGAGVLNSVVALTLERMDPGLRRMWTGGERRSPAAVTSEGE